MKILLIGPYSYLTLEERDAYIAQARDAMIELLRRGHSVYCPHTMTAGLESVPGLENEAFMQCTLDYIAVSDAVYLLPGWQYSRRGGCNRERKAAEAAGCYIYERMEEVPDGRRT